MSDINDVAQEYRDAKENMPEGLQEGGFHCAGADPDIQTELKEKP